MSLFSRRGSYCRHPIGSYRDLSARGGKCKFNGNLVKLDIHPEQFPSRPDNDHDDVIEFSLLNLLDDYLVSGVCGWRECSVCGNRVIYEMAKTLPPIPTNNLNFILTYFTWLRWKLVPGNTKMAMCTIVWNGTRMNRSSGQGGKCEVMCCL